MGSKEKITKNSSKVKLVCMSKLCISHSTLNIKEKSWFTINYKHDQSNHLLCAYAEEMRCMKNTQDHSEPT